MHVGYLFLCWKNQNQPTITRFQTYNKQNPFGNSLFVNKRNAMSEYQQFAIEASIYLNARISAVEYCNQNVHSQIQIVRTQATEEMNKKNLQRGNENIFCYFLFD